MAISRKRKEELVNQYVGWMDKSQALLLTEYTGLSMKQVAAVLNLTPRTVAFHKYQMMSQLNIKTTAELIRYAVRHNIV